MSDRRVTAVEAAIRARRSVRRFRPEVPPRDLIDRLLNAAIRAPSASNQQPWKFVVITRRAMIDALASEVRAAVDRIAPHVRPQFESAFRAYGDYFTRFAQAPVVIVALARVQQTLSHLVGKVLPSADRASIEDMERDSALIGVSLAVQNLLLTAHAHGLGASGMTGPRVADPAIRRLLSVPPSWHVVAFIPLGYPGEEARPTDRKSLDLVVRWIE